MTSVPFRRSTQIGRLLCRIRRCDIYTESFCVQFLDKRTSQNKSRAQKKASSLPALCSALRSLTRQMVGEYGNIYHVKDIRKHVLLWDDQIFLYFMLYLCICKICENINVYSQCTPLQSFHCFCPLNIQHIYSYHIDFDLACFVQHYYRWQCRFHMHYVLRGLLSIHTSFAMYSSLYWEIYSISQSFNTYVTLSH